MRILHLFSLGLLASSIAVGSTAYAQPREARGSIPTPSNDRWGVTPAMPHVFEPGEPASAREVNENFEYLLQLIAPDALGAPMQPVGLVEIEDEQSEGFARGFVEEFELRFSNQVDVHTTPMQIEAIRAPIIELVVTFPQDRIRAKSLVFGEDPLLVLFTRGPSEEGRVEMDITLPTDLSLLPDSDQILDGGQRWKRSLQEAIGFSIHSTQFSVVSVTEETGRTGLTRFRVALVPLQLNIEARVADASTGGRPMIYELQADFPLRAGVVSSSVPADICANSPDLILGPRACSYANCDAFDLDQDYFPVSRISFSSWDIGGGQEIPRTTFDGRSNTGIGLRPRVEDHRFSGWIMCPLLQAYSAHEAGPITNPPMIINAGENFTTIYRVDQFAYQDPLIQRDAYGWRIATTMAPSGLNVSRYPEELDRERPGCMQRSPRTRYVYSFTENVERAVSMNLESRTFTDRDQNNEAQRCDGPRPPPVFGQ